MTRKKALTALLERVEAGGATPRDFDGMDIPEMDGFHAFEGSLDAALALQEAVLPGCNQYSIVTDPTCLKVTVCWWPDGLSEGRQFYGEAWGHPGQDARAWLQAILQALIKQEAGE